MAKRLIKLARDFNVGVSTIVDFLTKNGFEIDNKPTAKVTSDMEVALQKEFQKSIAIKEQADQMKKVRATGSKSEKETSTYDTDVDVLPPPPPEKKVNIGTGKTETPPKPSAEPIVLERKAPILNRPKILGKVSLGNGGRKKNNDRSKRKAREEELKKAREFKGRSVKEQNAPKEEAKPDAVNRDKNNNAPNPKRQPPVAKQRGNNSPKKVEQKPVEQKKVESKKVEQKPTDQKNVEPKKENQDKPVPANASSDGKPKEASTKEGGLIRAETPELRGLKVKGKIDLGKFSRKPKKKDKPDDANKKKEEGNKSSNTRNNRDNNNRRRKRKRKVITNAPATGNSGSGKAGERKSDNENKSNNSGNRERSGSDNRQRDNNRTSNRSSNNNRNNQRSRGRGNDRGNRRPSNKRDDGPKEVSKKEIEEKIKATMERLSGRGKKKRQKLRRESRERQREKQEAIEQAQSDEKIQLTEFISVSELASLLDISASDVIMTCMNLGVIVSINQRLDAEIIELIAEEYEKEVEFISAEEQVDDEVEIEDDPADLKPRSPIVTVMGHVDHGKTSLLDYIRNETVAAGEAGGITQHIGAYEVVVGEESKKITFLDTPGHEAFTAMRARGAKVTDIAIIIIAADDDIMPQTKEAISHAQAAGVPMIFAINKIDKPGANPEKIKGALAEMNFLVEDWGGKYQSQDISAKHGDGIDDLLEKIILEAELLELQANPDRKSIGVILEASLDKGRGYVTKTLIQAGTLSIGDPIVAGEYSGKVKAMFNEHGKRIKKVGPSQPVMILGLNGAPQAGERFKEVESETEARQIGSRRAQINREQTNRASKRISLDEIGRRLALGNFKELNLIIKGDVDGSIEALSDSLIKLSIESVQVNVIHKAVGQIIESDVLLASASDAIIIGFQVRPSVNARKLAEQEGVEIKMYSVIYQAIEEIKSAIEGMLEPTKEERIMGNVEIRETYKISKVGTIAGCYVQDGKITRNSFIRVIRDGIVVYPVKEGVTGEVASLRRFKDDVKEVKAGFECGLSVKNYNDIKVGDIIESYEIVEVKQKLK